MNNNYLTSLYNSKLFRDIDIALARLLARLAPNDPPGVALAALLVSRAAGEGHVCIDLHQWAGHALKASNESPPLGRCPDVESWIDQLRSSPMVGDADTHCPLVCDRHGRVYLQRLYRHEQQLAQRLRQRAASAGQTLAPDQLKKMRSLLNRYFGTPPPDGSPDWQKIAAAITLLKRLCIISGAPGTGKTTTVAKILAVLIEGTPATPLRIHLCAPTGKAAARLGASLSDAPQSMNCPPSVAAALAKLEASTIHRLLRTQPGGRGFVFNAQNPLPTDVVVVDEASMVDLVLMDRLVQAVPQEARLIILGDKDQLASVEAGAVFGDLCRDAGKKNYSSAMRDALFALTGTPLPVGDDHEPAALPLADGTVVLHKNFRFDQMEGIGALTQAINQGDSSEIKQLFRKDPKAAVRWEQWRSRSEFHKLLAAHVLRGYESYLTSREPEEALSHFNRFMILGALVRGPFGVEQLNETATDLLQKAGLIGRTRPWFKGRPVMMTRNSYRIGLFNGDIGLTWPNSDGRLSVWFQRENGELWAMSPQRLPEHQTAFAMTVHKSQGSEFDSALLILPDQDTPVVNRELIYTGCSRARHQLTLMAQADMIDLAVSRTVQRTSGLSDALWGEPGNAD
ncbi:MAG: exodeoxyribonuclease V subunit alpha [Desulfobacteraceae bacterium]|jgi:exodeoxyribonuclease V alpha subunit|nr:exodeoxyribonuclease V subunit alpha [Desulfobacteraceae bacterium]